jgi:hypothetical protein
MSDNYKNMYELPLNIELMFDNTMFDTISLLCTINCFQKKRKGIRLEELTFYYSMANAGAKIEMENSKLMISNDGAKIDADAIYMQMCSRINQMVGYLAGINLIDLTVNRGIGYLDISIKINQNGISLVKGLRSPIYLELMDRVSVLSTKIKYSRSNVLRIMGVNL